MACKDCKYWHGCGNDLSGDCYRIIAYLNPRLIDCKNDHGAYFSIPFDPHDVKYFRYDMDFQREYKKVCTMDYTMWDGFTIEKKKIEDVVYNDDGSERLGVLNLYYFKTNRLHSCGEEKPYAI